MAINLPSRMSPLVPEEERLQEDSIHANLARLQEMHVALRHLRGTIANVVSSIQAAESTPDPAELYARFSSAATGAGRDIKSFMQIMGDERAKELFEQVRKSREADEEGIEGWRVTEHEDWLDIKKEDRKDKETGDAVESEKHAGEGQQEDREKVVQEFRKAHPGIEVHLEDIITVKLPKPVNMNFFVAHTGTPHQSAGGAFSIAQLPDIRWRITGIANLGMKETKLTETILDAITTSERKHNDLGAVLEMVASYSDVTTRPCTNCSRLIDRTGQIPIVRTIKSARKADGQSSTQWQAFHRGCT